MTIQIYRIQTQITRTYSYWSLANVPHVLYVMGLESEGLWGPTMESQCLPEVWGSNLRSYGDLPWKASVCLKDGDRIWGAVGTYHGKPVFAWMMGIESEGLWGPTMESQCLPEGWGLNLRSCGDLPWKASVCLKDEAWLWGAVGTYHGKPVFVWRMGLESEELWELI